VCCASLGYDARTVIELGRRAFLAAVALLSPFVTKQGNTPALSVDDFLQLSSRLTGHTSLDRDAAGVFLNAILATPDGARRLRQPDDAFEREIIAAWYTGIHEFGGERRLATHTGALQWRALGMPAPGTCAGRFGDWSTAPRALAR
jgi:hypothetical protein